jgi:hypothetical protein
LLQVPGQFLLFWLTLGDFFQIGLGFSRLDRRDIFLKPSLTTDIPIKIAFKLALIIFFPMVDNFGDILYGVLHHFRN